MELQSAEQFGRYQLVSRLGRGGMAETYRSRRGQSMVEYVSITAALLGSVTLGWPFLAMMLNALSLYFQSLYYVIQSPLL